MNPDALKNMFTTHSLRLGMTAPDSDESPGGRVVPFEVNSWAEATFWLKCGYTVHHYTLTDNRYELYQSFLPGDI